MSVVIGTSLESRQSAQQLYARAIEAQEYLDSLPRESLGPAARLVIDIRIPFPRPCLRLLK
jgi:hypothetical protein